MPGLYVPDRAEAGRVLGGRYRLIQLIARGGMAEVWEAYDEVLARPVAAKVLQPELAADGVFLERFRREAVSAARLAHSGVVSTFDTGVDRGIAYIVMELVRGRTLREEIDSRGRLEPWRAAWIARQIADALLHAHRVGLVHRDIKPANVLLADDDLGMPQVKITDFGIAKASAGLEGSLTRTGTVMGTPKYLSPEQIRGGEPDARADLYSVGVVLFEMLSGVPPFVGDTDMATALAHLHERVPKVSERVRGVPGDLDRLVVDLLAKDPARRVPSALDLRNRLDALDLLSGDVGSQRRARSGRRDGNRPSARWPVSPNGNGGTPGGYRGPAGSGRPGADPGPRPSPVSPVSPGRSPTDGRSASAGWPGGDATADGGGVAAAGPSDRTGWAGGVRSSTRELDDPAAPTRGRASDPSGARLPAAYRAGPRRRGGSRLPGLIALALLVVAGVVAAVVVLTDQAGSGPGAGPGRAVPISSVSVYLPVLGHTLDDANQTALAFDGNSATAWHTDQYSTPAFGNLYPGIGLAIHLSRQATLHRLSVTSTSQGWSAEAFVADRPVAVGQPVTAWGTPTATVSGVKGDATLSLDGRTGSWVLLWLTNLGPARQVSVAELAVA